jgi:lysozyme
MRDAEADVRKVLPQFDDFSANRQIALISIMFAGIRTFMEFKRMIAAINRMDWNTAADELLDSKYAKVDVPNRAKRLAKMLREG